MKKFLVAAIAAICALGASAQRASDSTSFSLWDSETADQKIVIGIRAGLNISNMSANIDNEDPDLDSKAGFRAGVSVDFPIVNSFYINSGLFYTTRGCKSEYYDDEESEKLTLNAGYIELPVYASYRLNLAPESQIQVNFGPYFAYGVNGKAKTEYTYRGETESEKADLFGIGGEKCGFKRFDCGLGIGAGYTFQKFYIGFEYQFGLVNIVDKKMWEEDKIKNKNFNISIGYNF